MDVLMAITISEMMSKSLETTRNGIYSGSRKENERKRISAR